ncbi:DUF1826 domain-containing protein [Novosphingobium resinovorum]|uniref:DUF1826 domain-containing protein n=1 Tax=Novosphingobium resinovorum TaxID=158500 RepID=UPI002ED27767
MKIDFAHSHFTHSPAKSPAAAAIAVTEPEALAAILRPEVQLAFWTREPASAPVLDPGAIDWSAIDDIAQTIDPALAPVEALLADAGFPAGPAVRALGREIAGLASLLARIARCDEVRLRLEVIESDACRKFHMDWVDMRLLATFYGPGTQWIEVNAERNGGADAPVHQLRCGEVAIFKGRLAVQEPQILHRSPPITGTGVTRLLLAIDPAG